jgi:hypothetical protein
MTIDARFITAVDLEEYFVDKTSGEPLSGGLIYFFEDENRNTPKAVYTISGGPPNYTYVALPNPLTLSAVGTPQDGAGNNVPIFYFPYEGVPADNSTVIELYYITVQNSAAVPQFTREAWPNLSDSNNPQQNQANISNELSNPQFAVINFANENPYTITLTGANTFTIPIAPDWDLVVTTAGNSTVQVQRNAIAGSAQYPGNAPYTLTITPGLNIGAGGINLRQRFTGNPDIFSPANGGTNGWISASILIGPGSSASVSYQPNGQAAQQILNDNNATGNYVQYNATVQLAAASNPSTPDNGGYVDILVGLANTVATTIGNVQIVGLDSNIANVDFEQTTINRQIDQLFNYYNQPLQYKPIPSYLVGWDFALNPAQFLGHTVAASAIGANASKYVWDQTILFQSTNTGAAVAQVASGALQVTATNATQFALIQYIPQEVARKILNEPNGISSNVRALVPAAQSLVGTVSVWYTTNVNLPDISANVSLVTTLDANGHPSAVVAGWNELTRNGLPNAQFTVLPSPNTTNFNDYGFNNWNLNGVAAANTATWMAIVVGFANLAQTFTIDIASISLVPGKIPTIPAPQTLDQVEQECGYYYQKSFNRGVVPVQNAGLNTGEMLAPWVTSARGGGQTYVAFTVQFKVKMFKSPTATTYNPGAANAQIRNVSINPNADFVGTTVTIIDPDGPVNILPNQNGFAIGYTGAGAAADGDVMAIQWTADARLGMP